MTEINLPLVITPSALNKIQALLKATEDQKAFRVAVQGGGCAGYQYEFGLVATLNADDELLEGVVVVDAVSRPFLLGATLDYVDELGGSFFKVIQPSASSTCGCGNSFSM